jgi:hypothetical protein
MEFIEPADNALEIIPPLGPFRGHLPPFCRPAFHFLTAVQDLDVEVNPLSDG